MTRAFTVILAAAMALAGAANAATPERLRGTLQSVSSDSVSLQTAGGATQTVAMSRETFYTLVSKAAPGAILPGSYISAAAKGSGPNMVALEVDIFPPALRDENEGHFPWDPLPDITRPGFSTATTLTNGSVQTVSTLPGAKQISVVYTGGKQIMLVLPATPVVTTSRARAAMLQPGMHVVIFARSADGKTTAIRIVAGANGITPPM